MSDPEIVKVWMRRGSVQVAFETSNGDILIVDSVGQVSWPLIFQGPEWVALHNPIDVGCIPVKQT